MDGDRDHSDRTDDQDFRLETGTSMDDATMFQPDERLADRFRILRFIARGGMGEVYEAEDVELRERVALKVIRLGVVHDERTVKRFIREVNLSRRVTHPNVCRIFDVFHHELPPDAHGRARRVPFVAMELLLGETLSARLQRAGPMPESEAGPIVEQMAAALSAAHQAGVIHRDLKSSNVMLLPATASRVGVRAVVTDFGLAHQSPDADFSASEMTRTGEVFGTPKYMAPEQVEGGAPTPATDIYSLGVVMYEMVTGTTPFVGETPLSTAVKRLQEAPQSPRTHAPHLSPQWERAILTCLARKPADRFASATDVIEVLSSADKIQAPSGRRHHRNLTPILLAVVAALLVVLGVVAYRSMRSPASPPVTSAPAAASRRAVAVLGFRNLSGRQESAWLSTAFAEMLTTELSAGENLRVIPGESVTRAQSDLGLSDGESFAAPTLIRIRDTLGTDLVVFGSYLATAEGRIRLDLRLQDAVAGETVATLTETATEQELIDLISRAGARLRARLGVAELSPEQVAGARAALPSSPDAARLYAEGLTHLRLFDALTARSLLEKAVAADPKNATTRAALAAAWSDLGYDGKAAEQAKAAVDASTGLSREKRLVVEAQYAEATREWSAAVQAYTTLWSFFPDNVDYGLQLASAQLSEGNGKSSLETVASLRALPAPASGDPRIDIAEAAAARALSDFARQQAAATQAATKANAQGARLLLARARLLQGEALEELGEGPKAIDAYGEAQRIYSSAGDRRGEARALNNIAIVYRAQGDLTRARSMYERALATYTEIGDERNLIAVTANLANVLRQQGDLQGAQARYQDALEAARRTGDRRNEAQVLHSSAIVLRQQGDLAGAKSLYTQALAIRRDLGIRNGVASTLNNLGNVLYDEEDLEGARKMYEESLAISREIGDKSAIALALGNIAGVFADQGRLEPAAAMYAEALTIRRDIGNKSGIAQSLNTIANLLEDQGNLVKARETAEEALGLYRELGETRGIASVGFRLGEIRTAQGELADARRHHEEALALRQKLEERGTTASSRLALARLSLLQGNPTEAESIARQAAAAFTEQQAEDDQAQALALVAEALTAQRRGPAARDVMARAASLGQRSQNRLVRFSLALSNARVDAATGRTAEARRALESTVREAAALGFRGYELEARLRLGEIEIAGPDRAAGRTRLTALAQEASTAGFGSIAQRATTAAAR